MNAPSLGLRMQENYMNSTSTLTFPSVIYCWLGSGAHVGSCEVSGMLPQNLRASGGRIAGRSPCCNNDMIPNDRQDNDPPEEAAPKA